MKTSNKLLIALAVSLIIIPIIVIAVNVKMNYKNEKAFYKNLKENTDFKSELDGYTIKELPAFSSVNLNDGNDSHINFVVVKSDKSGIKIPTDLTEMYDIKVDNNNILQITLKNADKKLKYSLTAYIYSNNVKNFNISKAAGFNLDIKTDTVTLTAKEVNNINFQELTAINYLIVNTDKVKDLRFSNDKINNIDIDLNNSNFNSLKSIFQSVNINSAGKSNIEIYGDEKDKSKYQINNLAIKTAGTTELNIDFVKVAQSTGSLSDSTRISGSASILKSMLKN